MVDIWDTAGQDVFDKMHPAYYFEANAALLVFDTTRKITYKNCTKWYNEFRSHCPSTPCILVGNKIGIEHKKNPKQDYYEQIMDILDEDDLFDK